uniref:Coenzyme PQQ synthesis protein F-like C-terminal lobe domain-containing protein n=1 Tax=Timema douglasi TaxID=61478 RepID=A0A7R8VUA9_TIMDO|nr:unnamed protein product [Timema douglasi]
MEECLLYTDMLMEEPLFNNLRTKEQLGYSVSCELRDTFGILGFTISVNSQANKHSAGYIDERIEEFLKTFSKFVETLPSEDLKEVRNSLIKLKESTDLYLREEVTRNWHEIINQEYVFDRRTKEVKFLQEITLKELQTWLEDHLSNGNQTKFRKLSIQPSKEIGRSRVANKEAPCSGFVRVDLSQSPICQERHFHRPAMVLLRTTIDTSPLTPQTSDPEAGTLPQDHHLLFYKPPYTFVIGHVRPSDGGEEHVCVQNVTTQGTARKYSFHFVTDTQTKSDQRFITDIDVFKSNLVIYPFTRIVS